MTCKDCIYAMQPTTTMRCRNHFIYVPDNAVVCNEFKSKPQTNYDRIISKTPEELADYLAAVGAFSSSRTLTEAARKGWLGWLNQEAKE